MSENGKQLMTPVVHKVDETVEPPAGHPVSYLLAGNGLFVCRSHPFFSSCVVARDWPGELAPQEQYLKLRCPKLSQAAFERIVGFFARIADLHGSEAAAMLVWNRREQRLGVEIPRQRATVSEGWNGTRYATDVRYDTPSLDGDCSWFGSVHSHVDGPAYSSHVDRRDESHLTGLHVVVGRIWREPPEIHCEYVVDGVRFKIDTRMVIEGYARRDTDVPNVWIERVAVDLERYESRSTYHGGWYDRKAAGPRSLT